MSFDTDDLPVVGAVRSLIVPAGDVLVGTGLAAVTVVVGLAGGGLVRGVLGLVLLLFLHGYAVTAALFPGPPPDTRAWVARRVAIPFGASLALLPPIGLVFALANVPFTGPYVLGVVGTTTVLGLVVAGRRRVHLPPGAQSASPLRTWASGQRGSLADRPATELLVNAVTLVAALTAVAGLVFAMVGPAPAADYTSFAVLTENESGQLVASDYPTEFTAGEGQNLALQIANQGPDAETYTVLVQLQQFDTGADAVTDRSRLLRLEPRVAAGTTWNRTVTVTPDTPGQQQRLAFLLYRGEPPATPTIQSAEEHLFLWVNVSDATGPAGVSPAQSTTPGSESPTVTATTATGNTTGAPTETATTPEPATPSTPAEGTSDTPTTTGGETPTDDPAPSGTVTPVTPTPAPDGPAPLTPVQLTPVEPTATADGASNTPLPIPFPLGQNGTATPAP